MHPRRLGITALGGALGCCLLSFTMLAASPTALASFKVFPTLIDVKRHAGRAVSGTFNVGLKSERGRQFAVTVQDVVQQPDGTYAYQQASRSPFSASAWATVSPRRFSGSPDRTQPVEYRVLVPRRAEPGDHITSLTVRRLAKNSQSTAEPIQAVSVRLDIRVSGAAKPAAQIISLGAPSVAGSSPVDVATTVRNTGNVSLDFDHANRGSLSVTSGSDRKANADFSGMLYPGQSRIFQLSWSNPPLFGSYTATASVDTGARVVSDSKSIFVVPWRQLGALILVGLAAIVLVIGSRRRRRRA